MTGQRDEAAYAAPAAYVLDENLAELVPVLHGWNGGPATPLIRLSGNVPSAAGFTFLAMPWSSLPATGGWRPDFASQSLPELAKAIKPGFPTALRSTKLPSGREFALPVSNLGDRIGIRAYFRSPLGDFDEVTLGATAGPHTTVLHGRIPFAGATLTSLVLYLLNGGRAASNGQTGIQPSARGVLTLGTPRVDGTPVRAPFAGWIGVDGGVRQRGSRVRLAYSMDTDRTTAFRPRQPTDRYSCRYSSRPRSPPGPAPAAPYRSTSRARTSSAALPGSSSGSRRSSATR